MNNQLDRRQVRRFRRYLAEERLESDTYRYLARSRTGEEREVLLRLSQAEERHERYWMNLLGERSLPAPKAPLGSRLFNFFARNFGTIFILAMMQHTEQRNDYESDNAVPEEMAADERIHSEVVRSLAQRQRATMAGTFRAAVFGINDGLVSTCALILGVMGAGTSKSTVVASGIAGMLAGAMSMGAGEYVSVHSQTELLEASDPDPDAESAIAKIDIQENELALVFRARGVPADQAEEKARQAVEQIRAGEHADIGGPAGAHEEVGTGFKAALSSFFCFALGAFIPLFPFLLPLSLPLGAIISVILVGIMLLGTGSIVGLLSGCNPLPKALRQLAIGYGAAAITFALGMLFGGLT